ncbi:MAG: hypothetical protein AAB658_21825, partial [Chloroflexota bacterium]
HVHSEPVSRVCVKLGSVRRPALMWVVKFNFLPVVPGKAEIAEDGLVSAWQKKEVANSQDRRYCQFVVWRNITITVVKCPTNAYA